MANRLSTRESVLIPGTFSPACYACTRSLAKRGLRPIVASEHRDVSTGWSRFCDERITICSPNEDLIGYADALKRIAARPSVRTILPIRPADAYVLAKYRDEFERNVSVPVASMETLDVVTDRKKLHDAASDAGVPVPETWTLDEFDRWDDEFVIKSRYNLLTTDQVPTYASNVSGTEKDIIYGNSGDGFDRDEIVSEMQHVPIVQEYVSGTTQYVFAALYDHGDAVATFQHRQIRGESYTGGGGVYRESIREPELEAVGRTLLDSLDWHGIACIEYVKDENTGEYKLLEINPRFWQSLPCATRAGADFPTYYWLQATGRSLPIDPGYEIGVKSHFLYGELRHLLSVTQENSALVGRPSIPVRAGEILLSCLLTPNFDILRFDDPLPFLQGFKRVVKNRAK